MHIRESPGKGLGAFAATPIPAFRELGHYKGEVLTLRDYEARYGIEGEIPDADAEWHFEWSRARRARGVGVTGQYVFAVGSCPLTSR